MTDLPYPPPYQDLPTLAQHICVSERSIENWVNLGQFPRPKKVGTLDRWSWSEVRHFMEMRTIEDIQGNQRTIKEYEDSIINFPYPQFRKSRIYFVGMK